MRFLLILSIGLAVSACGNDDNGGGGEGLDLDIGPGEVRAGRLSQDQLPDDPNGLAVWEAGDFALVNEHIALIIEDDDVSDLYLPFGGSIVGITRYEDGALVDRADYNEFAIGLRRFLVAAETVSLINDGTDGNPAVVRAEGPLRALPFFEDVLNGPDGATIFGGLLAGVPPPDDETFQSTRVQVDYELAPGAEHLDVYYTVDTALTDTKPIYLMIQTKRMDPYVPGQGFGTGDLTLEYPYMAFADDDAASYAIEDVSGPMESTFALGAAAGLEITNPELSGVLPLARIQPIEFEAGKREHVMRLHVGGSGIDGLLQAISRTKGEPTRTITGTVQNADGSAAEGVRVHAETTDAEPVYLTRSLSGADGAYAVTVPESQEVQLRAYRRGDGISEPAVVEASSTSANVMLPPKGTIRVTATDADSSTALPVRVQVIDENAFQPPDNFGEPVVPYDDRLHVVFPTDGQTVLRAPAGMYQVVVSRGFEYDIFGDNDDPLVEVTAGQETSVNAELTRVVDSTGVMCGDFHIHTHRSPDATDSPEFKLMAAAGDGVELPVRTDHEFVAAFEPVVESLGLEAWMYGFSALELTTNSFGHFGVFPLEPDPSLPNDGAIPWNGIDESGAVEIFEPVPVFDDARSRPGDPEVIVFHPRSRPGTGGGFGELIGENYFMGWNDPFTNTGGVEYDPASDTILRMDINEATWWDLNFRVVEVFNDHSFAENKQDAGRIYPPDPEDPLSVEEDASAEIGTVDDWFGLLNSDDRADGVFAVGSSDSHGVLDGSEVSGSGPVGYPRTCVIVGTDDPETLRADDGTPQFVKGLVRDGRSVINGGFYILALGTGAGPGQTVNGAGPYPIDVEVQAPIWVGPLDLIEMWMSEDKVITSETIATGTDTKIDNQSVVRFSDSVVVPDGADWVVFHARGAFDPSIEDRNDQTQTLDPVHPDRLPFGVTNPIFFAP